ncbi:MAG: flagellar brake protein [Spirochaetales bacterium]
MNFFLIISAIAALSAYLLFRRLGGFTFPWVPFFVKGKESGFSFSEINLLRRVAVQNDLKNPTSLFWSEKTLDRCIRSTIVRFRSRGEEESDHAVDFLSKLYQFRKHVEFNQPKYRLGLRSTRNISKGQPLKITFPGASGAFTSRVVENMRKYLAITYPEGRRLPPGFSWQGQKISVYFWRQEDAGYYFESKVIGDYLERKYPILHIQHADQIVRTQKRRSVRAELKAEGRLFPLSSIEQANETIEKAGGYRGKMVDISEDGAAIMVGGKAKPGLPVKVQTRVNGRDVVLNGTVKGVSFKQKKNVSVLHIEAKAPSRNIRNNILTYVYNIFRDETLAHSSPSRTVSKAGESGGSSEGTPQSAEPSTDGAVS